MRPLAIAHRAGNSLAALHAANHTGADVIECDVHAHRGRLEVRHLKTAGPLPFLWDRWELVSAGAPRLGLDELLAADRRGSLFMLDLKGSRATVGDQAAALLHELAHDRPILVCGRWWPSVDAMTHLPYVLPVLSARTRLELAALRRRLGAGDKPVYGVSVHHTLLDPATVADLRNHVGLVMTWPVNDQDLLEHLLGVGVTGIISDRSEILARVLALPDPAE